MTGLRNLQEKVSLSLESPAVSGQKKNEKTEGKPDEMLSMLGVLWKGFGGWMGVLGGGFWRVFGGVLKEVFRGNITHKNVHKNSNPGTE